MLWIRCVFTSTPDLWTTKALSQDFANTRQALSPECNLRQGLFLDSLEFIMYTRLSSHILHPPTTTSQGWKCRCGPPCLAGYITQFCFLHLQNEIYWWNNYIKKLQATNQEPLFIQEIINLNINNIFKMILPMTLLLCKHILARCFILLIRSK